MSSPASTYPWICRIQPERLGTSLIGGMATDDTPLCKQEGRERKRGLTSERDVEHTAKWQITKLISSQTHMDHNPRQRR